MSMNWKQALALGLCSVGAYLEKKEPVAYLYKDFSPDGCIFYELPEYDTEIYPYLILSFTYATLVAYASSTPAVLGAPNYNLSTPCLRSRIYTYDTSRPPEKKVREEWGAWEVIEGGAYIYANKNVMWANHDIFTKDETLFKAKGAEPVPVYLPILLCDKEVVADDSYPPEGTCSVRVNFDFRYGDTLRVTFNGVVYDDVIVNKLHGIHPFIGNGWLYVGDGIDDGSDWFISYDVGLDGGSPPYRQVYLRTRTPGTYQLKIELIARAEE